jgi:hypothetical protein
MPCRRGTFQVEFLTLARLSGDERFANVALGVSRKQWQFAPDAGLIGVCEDSFYEYVIKSYRGSRKSCRLPFPAPPSRRAA